MKIKAQATGEDLIRNSILISLVAALVYGLYFSVNREFPKTESILFLQIKLTGISRPYDLIAFPLLAFAWVYFIQYLKRLKEENYTLSRIIKIYFFAIILLGFLISHYFSLLAGVVTCLVLCFLFGLGSFEFGAIAGLLAGIVSWVLFAVKSGLVSAAIPGISTGLLFWLVAYCGLRIRNLFK